MNLADINDAWNRRIKYLAEPEGQDKWQFPSETIKLGTGDCEDYALGKFFTIAWLTAWVPEFVTCKLEGQAHVVVVVNGWVLDNSSPEIVKLDARTDIEVVMRSTELEPTDPRFKWVLERMDSIGELIAIKEWLQPQEGSDGQTDEVAH